MQFVFVERHRTVQEGQEETIHHAENGFTTCGDGRHCSLVGTGAAFGATHQTAETTARHRTIRVHGNGSAVGRATVNVM